MCGRFSQSSPARDYARLLGVERVAGEILCRWNVAPSLDVAMCHEEQGRRTLGLWRWGFLPHWARAPDALHRPINARIESVAEKPMFRDAWRRGQRGLIPAEGFYEWSVERGRKQPWFVRRRDGAPLLLATVWDCWERPGKESIRSCAILVGPANELIAPLHDRMPLIIPPAVADRWLARTTPPAAVADLMRPRAMEELEAFKVSTRVNSAGNEGPELVVPL